MCFFERLSTEWRREVLRPCDPPAEPTRPYQVYDFKDFYVLTKKQADHLKIHSLGVYTSPEASCPPSYPQFLWIRDPPF